MRDRFLKSSVKLPKAGKGKVAAVRPRETKPAPLQVLQDAFDG
jgi:hypothetical protein